MERIKDLEYRVYTGKAEADKAVNSLRGILEGILIDGEVNKKELQELDNWCEDHYDLIERNPFQDFIVTIREALRGEQDLAEALEDLYWLSQKYQEDNVFYDAVTADLQTLQGICHGILADGNINDQEVIELQNWMDKNDHLCSYYPYDELYTVLEKILRDGIVDNEEKILLKAYFNQFVKLTDKELTTKISDEVSGLNISGLCAVDPNIELDGKIFCITGALTRGNRKSLVEKIQNQGGTFNNNFVKETNYLIVGDNGSPAWAFACYGRKVEKAIKLRKEGSNVVLVHEHDFWDYLDDIST
ncbi:hypothetical protein E0K83_03735 [Gramella sp. BOM4]|nr:hypothetical protein [Christiangramia bathymodioli]